MRHPAAITFYDELGVPQDATPEEIRDSFRSLVRILHPDHQTDEQLKVIAERQMRKLNGIYAVLSDPEKRCRYDLNLEDDNFGPTIVLSPSSNINVRRLMNRMVWVAASLLVVVTLIWLSSESPAAHFPESAQRTAAKADTGAIRAHGGEDDVAQLRSELRSARLERDLAMRELVRLRGASGSAAKGGSPAETAAVQTPPPATTLTELPGPGTPAPTPASAAAAHVPSAPGTQSAAARPFAGFWFYSKAVAHGKTTNLYPPVYIEATITEQNGIVKGKYRSRYKIVDRDISPDVTFEFAGTDNGSPLFCPWSGPGGSKGELTLKLLSGDSMKVDWVTTEPGSVQGLINGTATLIRRLD